MSSLMIRQFAPAFQTAGFFKEWGRYVEKDLEPGVLANYFMEQMRCEDAAIRQPYVACETFMRSRSWGEFLDELKDTLTADEKKAFSLSGAEKFYNRMVSLISAQINDYWNQFMNSYKAVQGEIGDELKDLPISRLEKMIRVIVEREVTLQAQGFGKMIEKGFKEEWVDVIVREIRKRLDEGESWKTGEEEPG